MTGSLGAQRAVRRAVCPFPRSIEARMLAAINEGALVALRTRPAARLPESEMAMASTDRQHLSSRAIVLSVAVVSALIAAFWLAIAGPASAQTAFQASVKGTGSPVAGCPNGAAACGTANIAGYGAGSWSLTLTNINFVPSSCDSTYAAITVFTLNSDGSTLVLNESGYGCGPGKDANGFFKEGPKSHGGPNVLHGTWTIDSTTSTGQFAGLGGSGADDLQSAGGHHLGSYVGTLG